MREDVDQRHQVHVDRRLVAVLRVGALLHRALDHDPFPLAAITLTGASPIEMLGNRSTRTPCAHRRPAWPPRTASITLHQRLVRGVRLGQHGGVGLAPGTASSSLHDRRQAPRCRDRSPCSGSRSIRPPMRSPTSSASGRITISSLQLVDLRAARRSVDCAGSDEVDHRQAREHRGRQQERHQHDDQVDERRDLEVRPASCAGGGLAWRSPRAATQALSARGAVSAFRRCDQVQEADLGGLEAVDDLARRAPAGTHGSAGTGSRPSARTRCCSSRSRSRPTASRPSRPG